MLARGGAGYPCPNLLKPIFVVLFGNNAQYARRDIRGSVSAWLALHKDELDIVFDNCVRLVRFAQKAARAVFYFVGRVGNFVPNNWCEIIETYFSAIHLYRRVKGDDRMATIILTARQAHVPDNANQPPPRHKDPKTVSPYLVEFFDEFFVIFDVAHLAF